jgi:hypothetical protein
MFAYVDSSNDAPAREILARYPQGQQVTVYYDPSDPRTCVLEPGATPGTYQGYLLGGLGLLCGPILLWVGTLLGPESPRPPAPVLRRG